MSLAALFVQLLNGLAGASTLFLIAAGLSLIFGVTRIVNFAHGSLFMLGSYIAYSLITRIGGTGVGCWAASIAAELFQLLATFALTLIVQDVVLQLWGSENLVGPRAPSLKGAIFIFGRALPTYDLALILIGPAVLGLLWLLLTRTRWGILIRAATQDRDMVAALGVNQAVLFTGVFALGAGLAALGGALNLPREPANLGEDITAIGDAFVVVVVGGMGSIPGAFLAALLIAEIKALCIALGQVSLLGFTISFPQFTLVAEFAVMAIVLVLRPWGLLGKPQGSVRSVGQIEAPIAPAGRTLQSIGAAVLAGLLVLPLIAGSESYTTVLTIDILVGVLFAVSLHFIMGPGGMHSFGHAAYFGLGAYGAGLLFKNAGVPMELALIAAPLVGGLGALLFGWFCVRLSGVYLAMLTLAFAQITWAIVFQWDGFTGGSNGLTGVWPASWLADRTSYYYLTLLLVAGSV